MAVTRRNLLKFGLLGALALGVSGVGLALFPGASVAPRAPLQALSPRQYAVLVAVAERLCPGGPGLPSATELDVAGHVDALLARMHPADAAEVGQLLLLFENALVRALLHGSPVPFSRASAAQQEAALESWRTSSLQARRMAFKALRGLVAAAYWSQPATWAHIGYPGPPDFGQGRAP